MLNTRDRNQYVEMRTPDGVSHHHVQVLYLQWESRSDPLDARPPAVHIRMLPELANLMPGSMVHRGREYKFQSYSTKYPGSYIEIQAIESEETFAIRLMDEFFPDRVVPITYTRSPVTGSGPAEPVRDSEEHTFRGFVVKQEIAVVRPEAEPSVADVFIPKPEFLGDAAYNDTRVFEDRTWIVSEVDYGQFGKGFVRLKVTESRYAVTP